MDTKETIKALVMSMLDKEAQFEPRKTKEFNRDIDAIVESCELLAEDVENGLYWFSGEEKKDIVASEDERV